MAAKPTAPPPAVTCFGCDKPRTPDGTQWLSVIAPGFHRLVCSERCKAAVLQKLNTTAADRPPQFKD